ncbi:DUF6377 domain-containing protein [Salinimicrobium sp. MT39]|uniref:DUF6377 domain-containing protein n=1 Tax=Salinimicrobium profundisediminis TaxID=2994553 RepID=A0A9X3CYA4_9FLAO|nr:DUF6377 domain-containing protein [Salinimicrobium profundisediminis]MCX2839081.1 DUF6377 domain-containing protein [Salinimicrobium profundisediminis]
MDRAKETAEFIGEPNMLAHVKMKEGFILLSSGLFMEAIDTLKNVPVSSLMEKDIYDYYFTQARLYYDLADYNNDQRFHIKYIQKGNFFIEQALKQVDSSSADFYAAEGLKRMKQHDWKKAKTSFYQLIHHFELSPEDFAVAASSLSFVLSQLGNSSDALKYLTLAAISDIRSATKENVALRNLASELYALGEIKRANEYVHQALEDATFYNARHRKFEISTILPIIERAQLFKVEQKNASLKKTVTVLAVLAVTVIIFLFIIYKQLKEKNKARQILSEYNRKLQEMNRYLEEADAIKQDYITYFLRTTSQLFSKIGHFQASTVQKIKTKQPEEVLNVVKQYSIQKERNEVFRQFDEVFLKLFPTFIEEFDRLFPKEKQKNIKSNELLSKEHRIFALYRLGIQDSQHVAEFMDLSVSTIYTYKARLKSTAIDKDNFEKDIMKIRS